MKKLISLVLVLCLCGIPVFTFAETGQSAADQLYAMQKMFDEADNVTLAGTYKMSFVQDGKEGSIYYTDVSVMFNNPTIVHITEYPAADQEPIEMYIVQRGSRVEVFSSDETREEGMFADTVDELDSGVSSIDSMVSSEFAGEETVTVNGVEHTCVRINIKAHVLDCADEAVYDNLKARNPAYTDEWAKTVAAALSDVLVPISYWIDKDTGMMVQMSADQTEFQQIFYEYISDEYDGGFVPTACSSSYQVIGMNDAQEISIPAKYIAETE